MKAIIDQYIRHGWQLRRILLSRDSEAQLSRYFKTNHPETPIRTTDHDGLWFSRRSLPDKEAWELRRLSDSPFALVAVIEDSLDEPEREQVLRETERQMFHPSRREPLSH